MVMTFVAAVRDRLAAYRAYRCTIAEIASMSHAELVDLRADRDEMRRVARQRLTGH